MAIMKKKKIKVGFEIGGHTIYPGESQSIELYVARLYTHTPITRHTRDSLETYRSSLSTPEYQGAQRVL